MFLRLLWESFARQRRRKALAGLAILLGTTAVTAMLALATTIGDRIHSELAVYGANIIVYPKADALEVKVGDESVKPSTGNAYLHESDLAKLRGIFWANNITGMSPELPITMDVAKNDDSVLAGPGVDAPVFGLWFHHALSGGSNTVVTGAPELHPSWKLTGSWPTYLQNDGQVVLGSILAKKLGAHIGDSLHCDIHFPHAGEVRRIGLPAPLRVVGIVTTGDAKDFSLLMPLRLAQELVDQPDAVTRVEISARTKPEDAFARRDPDSLSPKDRDVWYCRPYANSIAYQIREAIPGAQAEQVRQVEQSEGTILQRISGLMWLIAAASLLAAAVAVSSAMATAVMERRAEIGLMRSLGASRGRIAALFYAEAGALAVIAGSLGFAAGSVLAAELSAKIFGGAVLLTHAVNPVLLPVVLGVALLVAIAGSTASIRGALRMDPSAVLRASA